MAASSVVPSALLPLYIYAVESFSLEARSSSPSGCSTAGGWDSVSMWERVDPRRFSNTHSFYRLGLRSIDMEPKPGAVGLLARGEKGREPAVARRRSSAKAHLGCLVSELLMRSTVFCEVEAAEHALQTRTHRRRAGRAAGQRSEQTSFRGPAHRLLVGRRRGPGFGRPQSNDWRRYRPECVLLEALDVSIGRTMRGATFLSMKD